MLPSLSNIILGLIGIALGVYMMKEAYFLNHQVYFISWAENKWGPGSGTLMYRYVGLGIAIFSVFVLLGIINLTDNSTFENPAGSSSQQSTQSINTPPPQPVQIAP